MLENFHFLASLFRFMLFILCGKYSEMPSLQFFERSGIVPICIADSIIAVWTQTVSRAKIVSEQQVSAQCKHGLSLPLEKAVLLYCCQQSNHWKRTVEVFEANPNSILFLICSCFFPIFLKVFHKTVMIYNTSNRSDDTTESQTEKKTRFNAQFQ